MLRKRFKGGMLVAVAAVAALGTGVAHGQAPASAASAGAASSRPAIWAATAEYVYKDDPNLKQIEPELLKTIKSSSVQAFNHSIDDAVALENKQLPGQKRLLKFQGMVKTIQEQLADPNDANALAKAIVAKLDDNAERMADPARAQQLAALSQRLDQLAAGAAPVSQAATAATTQPIGAGPAVPDPAAGTGLPAEKTATETATTVEPPTVAPVAPAAGGAPAWVSWSALLLALAGIILSFVRGNKQTLPATVREADPTRTSRTAFDREKELTELVKNLVRDEIAKQEKQKKPSTAAVPGAPSSAKNIDKSAPAAPAPAPAPVASAPEADEFESLLAPLPAVPPAPRLRQQFVDEAPFNNGFPARALRDQPGTYSMFVISSSEQQPEQGTFAVTGNLASHVSDHRNVLEPVCEYVGGYPLGSEARVVTVEPGHVRRRGDDWEVVQRAKVRFE